MNIEEIIYARLRNLYLDEADVLSTLQGIVQAHATKIVDVFYEQLLGIPETRLFFEHATVDKNLKASLHRWLHYTVEAKDQDGIKELVTYQKKIGQVHANINIRFSHFSYGISIIKRELYRAIDETADGQHELARTYRWLNEIFDILTFLVSESYLHHELSMRAMSCHSRPKALPRARRSSVNASGVLCWTGCAIRLPSCIRQPISR
jgi:hemoglobin-like flavoprotein